MHPFRRLAITCRCPRTSRYLAVLVAVMLALMGRGAVTASETGAPPALPDAVHVREGCYISAFAYLARFRSAFPEERGSTLRVDVPGFAGSHTVALVSWKGNWWVRDEYCGVFALERSTASMAPDAEALRARAETLLRDLAHRMLRDGRLAVPSEREPSLMERTRDVEWAAAALPLKSTTYWVNCDGRDLPFLFFVPEDGMIAVYDPASGTARAASVSATEPDLVRVLASRLGYTVTSVRSGTNASTRVVAALTR